MQDAIAAALEKRDFRAAAALLQQWKQQDARDPKFLLMVGRYQEATERWEQAEKTYLRLLRQTPNQKLIGQARQGIQRVQSHREQAREEAIETARARPDGKEPGVMCLEPVPTEQRQAAAQGLAKVLGIDAYMARLQIPSREWRLYRVGPIGDLEYYSHSLTEAQVPAFWVKHAEIKAIPVFNTTHFRRVQPQAEVVCKNADGQLGTIAFEWSEVSQIIRGQLPMFESVVDTGAWRQLQRKEKTQDYAEVIDLHLHRRQCILRLCDRTYDYGQSGSLSNADAIHDQRLLTRPHWQALTTYIREQTAVPTRDKFANFGEGAIEMLDLLPPIQPQLHLSRVRETNWDPAFHLYSSLYYLRHAETANSSAMSA